MNTIPNRQAICDILIEKAKEDSDIRVLCSDSRGSASLTPFAQALPKQFVEVGIAEQNLVSISAGLASCGKKVFAASPASFLSTRSMEQVKVDVAYSNTNVTLIGISEGVSYGALGMTHHSAQDIATMSSIPNLRVYLSSDRFQTKKLVENLLNDEKPSYIRIGRNAVADIYNENDESFVLDKSILIQEGNDITIIACGEMVFAAKEAGEALAKMGISARVIDMYCVKPIDIDAVIRAARETKSIVTIEEHSYIGGMGAMVSQIVTNHCPTTVKNLALPDSAVVTGTSKEVFDCYKLNAEGISVKDWILQFPTQQKALYWAEF